MKILGGSQIKQKVKRMAYQIVEENFDATEIILIGINNNGYKFAELLLKEVKKVSNGKVSLNRLRLNPAQPLDAEVTLEKEIKDLKNKTVIIIDDVANTGRTIFFAFKPLLEMVPDKLEVAVLVDRTHKYFPIKVDYVGLSLATTMKEHIKVNIKDVEEMEVFLI